MSPLQGRQWLPVGGRCRPSAEEVQDAVGGLLSRVLYGRHEWMQLKVICAVHRRIRGRSAVRNRRFGECLQGPRIIEAAYPADRQMERLRPRGRGPVTPEEDTHPSSAGGPDVPQSGRAYLDASAGGYSQDSVCGLVKSVYGKKEHPRQLWPEVICGPEMLFHPQ